MKKRFSPCATAILRTLSYRSIFKYPVSIYQLHNLLITEKKYRMADIKQALEVLIRRHYVKEKDGLYSLYTTRTVDWKSRMKESGKVIREFTPFFKLLGSIPWVLFVGISGSVGAYNATPQSDVDVFIIVMRNRLWISRLFVVFLLKTLNKYPNKDGEAGKICPNLYVDEDRMLWKKENQNVYIAHDILMLQPMVNKNNAYLRFLKANNWVFDYLRNFELTIPSRIKKSWVGEGFLLSWLDTLLMRFQVLYMKKKKTTEIVHKNFLHFNKFDSAPKVLQEYKRILSGKKIS